MTTKHNSIPGTPTNNYGTWESCDAAIIAMAILRTTRPKGEAGKGIGANKEDWPMFKQIADAWAKKDGVGKEMIFQARHRVQKYHRQVKASTYFRDVLEGNKHNLIALYADSARITLVNEILHRELQELTGYGDF